MKKKLLISLPLLTLALLTACAKKVSTEYRTAPVLITDEYHRDAWEEPVFHDGKLNGFNHHPAIWRIYVEYEGDTYFLDNEDLYRTYHNRIGETVNATIEITLYDNGKTRQRPVALEIEERK